MAVCWLHMVVSCHLYDITLSNVITQQNKQCQIMTSLEGSLVF